MDKKEKLSKIYKKLLDKQKESDKERKISDILEEKLKREKRQEKFKEKKLSEIYNAIKFKESKKVYTVSAFKGKKRENILKSIYEDLTIHKRDITDYDQNEIIHKILHDCSYPTTEKQVYDSTIRRKKRYLERLPNKVDYVRTVAKIMWDLFNLENVSKAEIIERNNISPNFLENIIKFLEINKVFDSASYFNLYKRSGDYNRIVYDNEFYFELKKNLNIFIEKLSFSAKIKGEILFTSLSFFKNALKKGFSPDDMGTRKGSNHIAFMLIYYSLIYHGYKKIEGQHFSKRNLYKFYFFDQFNQEEVDHINLKSFYKYLPSDFNYKYKRILSPTITNYIKFKKFLNKLGWKLMDSREEFNDRIESSNRSPEHVRFPIFCQNKHQFFRSWRCLNDAEPVCPFCSNRAKIAYEKICNKIFSMGGTVVDSEDEFNNNLIFYDTSPSTTPVWSLCENNHLFEAVWDRIKRGHWCSFCGDRNRAVGNLVHPFFEFFTLSILQLRECRADFEPVLDEGSRPDVKIYTNNKFIRNSFEQKFSRVLSDEIDEILLDFTVSKKRESISDKFYRNYQFHNRILIIILFNDLIEEDVFLLHQELQNIPFKENVYLLNSLEFLEFLDLPTKPSNYNNTSSIILKLLKEYHMILELINSAIYSNEDFRLLNIKYRSYKQQLVDF